jgi:hypothetical protein
VVIVQSELVYSASLETRCEENDDYSETCEQQLCENKDILWIKDSSFGLKLLF